MIEANIAEVAHDSWDIAKNIDDPEQFALALAQKNMKGNPAASLTQIFTEGRSWVDYRV